MRRQRSTGKASRRLSLAAREFWRRKIARKQADRQVQKGSSIRAACLREEDRGI